MSESFKVLTDREHVLQRPQMYIGSVTAEPYTGIINYCQQTKQIVPGLIKVIEEVIQNSVDEHIRTKQEFATEISISINSTIDGVEVSVQDNGRGIPVELIEGEYRPVLAWTKLRAGSNFDDTSRVGAGMNGVGVSLTNIFSESFTGTTCDGSKALVVNCIDNMSSIEQRVSKSKQRGTIVQFIPDLKRFGLTEFTQDHIDVLKDRIANLSIQYKSIAFKFNGELIKFKSIKQVAKMFHEEAVSFEDENIALVFAPSGTNEEFLCLSYVNGIFVKNGGSHVDFVVSKVSDIIRESVKKKHKIDVMPNQIKQHLLVASWVTGFPNLKFDSQTKERITNTQSEVSNVFANVDFDKVSRQILATPSIIDPMIASILYKKELAERLTLAKKQKAVAKTRIVNHIAATDQSPENRMLLICEGLSAIGSLISVRDPKKIGGYPLKGKPLNIRGMKPVEIAKNKEIFELMNIIGLEFGKKATDLNYGKIAIFSDADTDGQHIFGLLLNFFSLWPDLFKEKRIYRLIAPLYYCTKGKDTKIFYTKEEFDQANTKGYQIEYFKGLGSMPEAVYYECVNNPRLIQVEADDLNSLEMVFGDDAQLRKNWLMA